VRYYCKSGMTGDTVVEKQRISPRTIHLAFGDRPCHSVVVEISRMPAEGQDTLVLASLHAAGRKV